MLDGAWLGEFDFFDHAVHKMKPKERVELNKKYIGFVFQSYHLIDNLTVYENLEIPLSYRNVKSAERAGMVCDTLDRFHIVGKRDLYPNQLSGGQQQLVAVARAVIANPKLILADEPTGNLHSGQGREIMELFKQLNGEGTTIIQVTHSEANAAYGNRVVNLCGRLDGEVAASRPPTPCAPLHAGVSRDQPKSLKAIAFASWVRRAASHPGGENDAHQSMNFAGFATWRWSLMAAAAEALAEEHLAAAGKRRIVVSIPDRQVALVEDGRVVKVYPVAVGAPPRPRPPAPTRLSCASPIPPGTGRTRWCLPAPPIRSARAGWASAARATASTAPTTRAPSGAAPRTAASACATPTSRTCSSASRSATKWSCVEQSALFTPEPLGTPAAGGQ